MDVDGKGGGAVYEDVTVGVYEDVDECVCSFFPVIYTINVHLQFFLYRKNLRKDCIYISSAG